MTVSKVIKRLVEQYDLAVERDRRGRVARVNVAQYDRLRGRRSGAAPTDAAKAYATARAMKTQVEAERGRLEVARLKGLVAPVAEVKAAAMEAVTLMRAGFDVAIQETALELAQLTGMEAGVFRPKLRGMKERALAEFCRGLAGESLTAAGTASGA